MSSSPPAPPSAGWFDRFAERCTRLVTSGAFFGACLIVTVLWLPTIFLIHSIDTWQLVINTLTSVLAFLLIALLQNSERRSDQALHDKRDRLAAALAESTERDGNDQARRDAAELRRTVRVEPRS